MAAQTWKAPLAARITSVPTNSPNRRCSEGSGCDKLLVVKRFTRGRMFRKTFRTDLAAALALSLGFYTSVALATPEFVEHIPANQPFGEPVGTTSRNPNVPREGEPVDLWVRIGYSFFYTNLAVYYTTDGSDPSGSHGIPTGATA